MTAKRLFDLAFATTGLVIAAPVWVVISALVKLEDGGPILFTQDRVGQGGRVFRAFKFRSMVPDAERVTGAVQATANDPRVTRIGRLLRATALDELPQLINIFRGDMSVVGPRPLRPDEADTTGDGSVIPLSSVPGYAERHEIRPGLTGLAQIYASRDIPRTWKFRYDRVYRRNVSLWLDVRLVLRSLWITFAGRWGREQPGGRRRRRRYNLPRYR